MKRVEGLSKLTGRELYVDDLVVEDCLWGATVRSPVSRGRIRGIEFGGSVDWSEYTVVDHLDIPGSNSVFLIEEDQPVLAVDQVRHRHEPVLLLAGGESMEGRSGVYLHMMREKAVSELASNPENGRQLWEKSEALIAPYLG